MTHPFLLGFAEDDIARDMLAPLDLVVGDCGRRQRAMHHRLAEHLGLVVQNIRLSQVQPVICGLAKQEGAPVLQPPAHHKFVSKDRSRLSLGLCAGPENSRGSNQEHAQE